MIRSKTRPLRIAHVITRLSVGGAQENTLLTVLGLMETPGCAVDLIVGSADPVEGDLVSRARERGVALVEVPALMRALHPVHDVVALRDLTRHLARCDYDIVHTHMSKAGVLGRLAAHRAGVPVVVHTLHAQMFHALQPWLVNQAIIAVKRHMARYTDHFLTVSERIGAQAVDAGIVDPGRLTTVYSGMELDWYLNARPDRAAVRAGWGVPAAAPVIGKVARMSAIKGHAALIDIAPAILQAVPDARFVLVGDGALRGSLEQRVRARGLANRIHFTGIQPREHMPDIIGSMDVLVHTSRQEGLARVLPQALALGVPCVAYDVDGAPEVVVQGHTGHLIAPQDTEGLTRAVLHLLTDTAERRRMGANGPAMVDPRFRATTMVRDIGRVYRRLLQARGYPPERIPAFAEA